MEKKIREYIRVVIKANVDYYDVEEGWGEGYDLMGEDMSDCPMAWWDMDDTSMNMDGMWFRENLSLVRRIIHEECMGAKFDYLRYGL